MRGVKSREAILDAAIVCIAELGASGATLDAIAGQAKVSRALLIFHFRSRDGLLVAVLDRMGTRFRDGWNAVLADDSQGAPDLLLRLIEYDVRFAVERPHYVAVWHSMWGEARGSALYREVGLPRDRHYRADLQGQLARIVTGSDDVGIAAVAKGLEAMLFGFWWQALVAPEPGHVDLAMRAIRSYLAAACLGRFDHARKDGDR